MVKVGKNYSSSTEFFFSLERSAELDGRYSIFGKLINGYDILSNDGEILHTQEINGKVYCKVSLPPLSFTTFSKGKKLKRSTNNANSYVIIVLIIVLIIRLIIVIIIIVILIVIIKVIQA